ncbi:MAG: hypothetical protein WC708_13725 [Lentisphaeria bacterium]
MPPVITIEQVQESLAATGAVETVKALKGQVIPTRFLRQLADAALAGEPPDVPPALFLALWPETPSAVLEQLAGGAPVPEVVAALARHPRTPQEAMQRLLGEGDAGTQALLAGSARLAPEVAEKLLASPWPEARVRLAANPGLAPAFQARLAEDPLPLVRGALARRGRLDAGALALLLHDDDLLVRAAAVTGVAADDAALLEWADTDDFYTQLFLLVRDELPAKVLESLCLSANPAIQELALARRGKLSPDEAQGLSEHAAPAVRCLVAAKPELPAVIQERLAADAEPAVRRALAANPGLGEAAAWTLLDSGGREAWLELAANPALSEEQLLELCDHAMADAELAKRLAARPGLTGEQLALLLTSGGETLAYHLATHGTAFPELDGATAERWAAHPVPLVRALAAGAAALPRQILAKLSIDPFPAVRRALAANPALPERMAGFLSTDADPETAALARQRLVAAPPPEPAPVVEPPDMKKTLKRIIRKAMIGE